MWLCSSRQAVSPPLEAGLVLWPAMANRRSRCDSVYPKAGPMRPYMLLLLLPHTLWSPWTCSAYWGMKNTWSRPGWVRLSHLLSRYVSQPRLAGPPDWPIAIPDKWTISLCLCMPLSLCDCLVTVSWVLGGVYTITLTLVQGFLMYGDLGLNSDSATYTL